MNTKILSLLAFLLSLGLTAQNVDVVGTVTDATSGQPLPGVNIIIKNTSQGTSTDFDGNFMLADVPINSVIVVSYLGFKTKEITVLNDDRLDIVLEEDAESLNEIVVIGYGTQTKKEITGAVSVVNSETIENLKPARVEQALQGQVAGVNITASSGSPGAGLNINIRGVSTNGDNRPLILVDGNVIEDLAVLNPADIESINVLKDATAGIYGVRAANGVILIKTKSGRKDMPLQIEIDLWGGVQETTRKIPVLNATEYALYTNEAYGAAGEAIPFPDVSGLGQGTDWQDEVFETAPIYNASVSMRGGNSKQTFAYGTSYFSQDGIVGGDNANFTRMTQKLDYNRDIIENLKANIGVFWQYTNRRNLNEGGIGSVLFNALNMAPTIPVRGEDGEYSLAEGLGNEVINPLAQIEDTYNRSQNNRISLFSGLQYSFLDYFTANVSLNGNYGEARNNIFRPEAFYGSGKVFNVDESEVVETYDIFRDYTFDANITYDRTLNEDHNLKVLLATSVFRTWGEFSGTRGFGVPGNTVENADVENAERSESIYVGLPQNPFFDVRLLSYFARVQYDYKGKYLFSALIRRDSSTRFAPDNRAGYFPSFSAGWVMSDENFMSDSNFVDFLKLRGSFGVLGNDRIADFAYTSLMNGEGTYVFNNTRDFGVATGRIANPDIQWEQQETFNVGLDTRFGNNKFNVTMDYYVRTTRDLLFSPEVSGLLGPNAPGAGAPVINAGEVRNSGFEFAIGYNEDIGDNWKIGVNFNFTTINNEVLRVNGEDTFIAGGSFGIGQDPPSRMEEGEPIGYFRGFKTAGIFQTQEEVDNTPTINDNVAPGDLIFVDINGDGIIDDDDRTNIGDPIPDATFGLNLNLAYKNFDFIAYAFAQTGNNIVRNYERNNPNTNRTIYALDRWTGPGTSNSFPRATIGAQSNTLFSDFYVEDGSFVRLQNVQLGYSLSDSALENSSVSGLRVYIAVQNLFTLTEYQGYDPTVSTGGGVGAGIDYGFYPTPRQFLLGMNLKF